MERLRYLLGISSPCYVFPLPLQPLNPSLLSRILPNTINEQLNQYKIQIYNICAMKLACLTQFNTDTSDLLHFFLNHTGSIREQC